VFPEEEAVVPDVVSAVVCEDVLSTGVALLQAQSAKMSARMSAVMEMIFFISIPSLYFCLYILTQKPLFVNETIVYFSSKKSFILA
jgi:hypothetical protein